MKNRAQKTKHVQTWAKRLLLAVLGLALGQQAAGAQEPRTIPKSYLNKGTVHLPIQIDDRVRPQIQEVQLFVRDGAQAPWVLRERVPATQPFFTYRATHEGEFWFSVVTVDKNGRSIPADVSKEPPGLIVVIDSTPPQSEVQILGSTAEGQMIRCDVRDGNPDPTKTRFFFQTRDQIWRSVEPVSGHPETFCIPGQAAITGTVRVTSCDLAGNMGTREFNLAALTTAKMNPVPTSNKAVSAPPLPSEVASVPPSVLPEGSGPFMANDKFVPNSDRIEIVSNKPTPSPLPQGPLLEQNGKTPFAVPGGTEVRTIPELSPPGVNMQNDILAKRHLVNNTHVFLDYQIEQTGSSGVGRVEIWCTRDLGRTWQKLGEDVNRKGQAEVDLPGEGVYGVTVIVSNGRGFGANPPKSGDTPDWIIEVDTTKPQAELLNVRSNPNGDDGSLHITWTAKDKNMAPEPVDLFFATNRQGPWLAIAKGLKNDGLYRWSPSSDIGSHAYIRLSVNDLAGNTAFSESVQPVPLDDMSRPRGRLVGITTTPRTLLGNAQGPLPPSGN